MRSLVIGVSGGIGGALADALDRVGPPSIRLGRDTDPRLDLLDEATIADAARVVGPGLTLIVDATGFLHNTRFMPEKSLRQIDSAHMAHSFAINAIGPALLMKHFLPLLARGERAVFATLSARVGSISDNRLGGWHAYRASKAALNQITRTVSIELARTNPSAICVALHPGTVDTGLSKPFAKSGLDSLSPARAADKLLAVIASLVVEQSGSLIDQNGVTIPF
jgi:NAD(P)-dependent dehydrogenase (short-subunit alcohol dehydrogenase family)